MLPLKYEFDPVRHIGKVNGEIWPSVTQLLQMEGIINYDDVPPEVLEAKRLIGIRVHAASVMIDNCNLDEAHFNAKFPECVPYLEGYRKFRVIEKFEPLHKENRLFSNKWKFHGAMDEVSLHAGIHAGHLCIIDYKCTFSMYASTGPQLSGYEILVRENAAELGIPKELLRKAVKRFGLLLKPTGNYDLVPFTDTSDMTDFQACLVLYWQKVNKYHTTKGVQ